MEIQPKQKNSFERGDVLGVFEQLAEPLPATATVTLPFELRQKSRFRARLDDGTQAGFVLERGRALRGGDCLRAEDGTVIRVVSASESVSTAFTRDTTLLARACYHLGNRHVALQIGDSWLRYLHDHVLDQMLEALGLRVFAESAPFEPESGAYGAGTDRHAHGHAPDHQH